MSDQENTALVPMPPQERASALLYDPGLLDQALMVADKICKSNMVPKYLRGDPGGTLINILTGHELGLSPMQSLRGLTVIDGRVGMHADLMVALVLRSPQCVYFRCTHTDEQRATFETLRKGDDKPTEYSFTVEDARRAHLLDKGPQANWQAWRKNMLRARCASNLASLKYQDVLYGIGLMADVIDQREREDAIEIPATVAPVTVTVREPEPSPPAPTAPAATPGAVDSPSAAPGKPAYVTWGDLKDDMPPERRAALEADTRAEVQSLEDEGRRAHADDTAVATDEVTATYLQRIADAATYQEVCALSAELVTEPLSVRNSVRSAYDARKAELRGQSK